MTHDTTPAGVYEIAEAKQLLTTLNFVVNESLDDDSDEQRMIFALIDAIESKLDQATTAIEAIAQK